MPDDLAYVRNRQSRAPLPVGSRFWDTEWGYSSQWFGDAGGRDPGARTLQAQRTSRELLSAWAVGFPMAIYYDIRDDGTDETDPESNFGLVQNDYTDKPAVVAVRTLTHIAAGHTFVGFLPIGPTSLHAILLVGAGDRVVALWSDAPASVTPIAIPTPTAAIDMLGHPLTLASDAGITYVTVGEVAGPVFLTFPNPVSTMSDAGVDADAGAGGFLDATVGNTGRWSGRRTRAEDERRFVGTHGRMWMPGSRRE